MNRDAMLGACATQINRGGFWCWHRFWKASLVATPPEMPAWTCRPCATGFTAITQRVLRGMLDRPRSGREPLLSMPTRRIRPARRDAAGPSGRRRGSLRCVDLKAQIAKRFSVEISERSVGRILNERGFASSQCVPSTRRLIRLRKRLSGKLLRDLSRKPS